VKNEVNFSSKDASKKIVVQGNQSKKISEGTKNNDSGAASTAETWPVLVANILMNTNNVAEKNM